MNFTIQKQTIGAKSVYFLERLAPDGSCGPVILWGTFPHNDGEVNDGAVNDGTINDRAVNDGAGKDGIDPDMYRHLCECVEEILPEKPVTILAFPCENWNRDFSPWVAGPVFGDEPFGGGGREMLGWLTDFCIPELRQFSNGCYRGQPIYIAGYSLAGLFALWSLYETPALSGVACCSGSLWFPGWDEYVRKHLPDPEAIVYLSLGGKEERTRNPVMATIGDRMREQERILKKEFPIRAVTLEWNSGGHFADSGKRLARGMAWLTENSLPLES